MSGTLRLRGSTSGYAELQAAAVAGDQTFILPAVGGTLLTTDSPIGNLTLELGSASQPSLRFEGDNDTGLFSSGANTLNLVTGGSNKLVLGATAHTIYSGTNGSVRALDIDSSGNIGIGTVNPTLTDGNGVHIAGSSGALKLQNTTNGNWAYVEYADESNTTKYIQGYRDSTGLYAIRPGATLSAESGISLDSSGNIGIGISSASSSLHVKGSTDSYLTLEAGSTDGNDAILFKKSTGEQKGAILYDTDDNYLVFNVNDGERIKIDSSGRLLVGQTSSPSIGSGQYAKIFVAGYAGGSPGGAIISIARDEAASAMSDDDTLGELIFSDNAGGTFASIKGSVDGQPSGTSDFPGRLAFLTTSDGAASQTERMRIESDGDVLIGTTDGSNSTGAGVKLKVNSTASVDVVLNTSNNVNLNHVYNMDAIRNGYRYYLSLDGGIRNFSSNNANLSDEREKKNIVDMDSTWSDLKQWTLRQFHFNDQDDSEDKRYGVIAQQIETVSPQVLSTFEINPTTVRLAVKETQMMWMAIKALQEAQARIETLEAKVAALENN